jgi:3-hydroxyacyl-[acyl-carrier-protein] dehydratase
MHFDLVDRVLEHTDTRIVTLKLVTAAEEYLQDHFATFPVLPGVLMLEAMVQAARRLVAGQVPQGSPLVLGKVRALKYGRFVKPGAALRVEVSLAKAERGTFDFRGQGTVLEPGGPSGAEAPIAVSGRFLLRPVKLARLGESGR